jgi:hypothetical protein
MSAAQVAVLAATGGDQPFVNYYTSLAAPITRYVRSTGSDVTGDGLTPSTAWKNVQHALDSTPIPLGSRLVINMTDYGTYVLPASICLPVVLGGPTLHDPYYDGGAIVYPPGPTAQEYLDFGYYYQSDVEIYAAPTHLLTIPTGTWAGSVDPVTNLGSFTVAGAGWTVNQWQNKLLWFNTGLTIGRVISNTADTLVTTMRGIPYFFGQGLDLRIQEESCTVDLSGVDVYYAFAADRSCTYGLTVAGLSFTGGVVFNYLTDIASTVLIGCSGVFGGLAGDTLRSVGCRWYDANGVNSSTCLLMMRSLWWVDSDRVENPFVYANGAGKTLIANLYKTGGDSIGEGYYHQGVLFQSSELIEVVNTEARDTGRGGLRLLNNQMGEVGYCRFTNCGYGGIRMEMQSQLKITGPIDGTGNGANVGGMGMGVFDQANVEFNWAFGFDDTNFTLHGTVGDMKCGSNPMRSNTDFFTGVPLANEYDPRCGARIYERPGAVETLTLALPTPDVSWRGMVKILLGTGGVGTPDVAYICLKKADGTYAWIQTATG